MSTTAWDAARVPDIADQPVLRGQTAIVTGAASGIGMATALALGRAGANIAVNYRSRDQEARAIAEDEQIHKAGAGAIAIQADVSKEADVERMVAEVVERFGRLDILVANAGLQQDAPFTEMTLQQWQTVIDVNLTGQFLCCRAAVRAFKRQGVDPSISVAAGKIICMSSVHEVIPWAGHANYAASKGGVMLMMKSIAQEVAPDRIRVNSIGPGAVRTGINRPAWETPEAYGALMGLVPYKRIGEPEDIARAAVWLASDASDYVNGITLMVDGGMCLYPGFADGG
jgi:glucose 1-dehydrogenase